MSSGGPFDPLEAVQNYVAAHGGTGGLWIVGGRVRDAFLGRTSLDTDLAVATDAIGLARKLAAATGGSPVVLDRERDIARVVWRGDLSAAGSPPSPGTDARQRVLDIKSLDGGALQTDLAGRDLTINALALPLSALGARGLAALDRTAVIDLHGGRADLEGRIVRMIGPSALDADPLRLLRAPRIALELGFGIERATRDAIGERAARAAEPAAERVRDELLRVLAVGDPIAAIDLLAALGLLPVVLPELARADRRPAGARGGPSGLDRAKAILARAVRLEQAARGGDADCLAKAAALGLDRGLLSEHLSARAFDGRPAFVWLRVAALLSTTARSDHADYDFRRGRWSLFAAPEALAAGVRATAARLRLSAAASSWLAAITVLADRPERLGECGMPRHALARAAYRDVKRVAGHGLDIALIAACRVWAEREADVPRAAGSAAMLATGDAGRGDGAAPGVDAALAEYVRQARAWETRTAPPDFDGRRLIEALHIQSGPTVGRLVAHLAAERAAGVHLDSAAAIEAARTLLLAERAAVQVSKRARGR